MTTQQQTKRRPIKAERAELIRLSEIARLTQQEIEATQGVKPPINEVLLNMHRHSTQQTEFHTLKEWNELGFKVRRNEKSFRIWSKPVKVAAKKAANDEVTQASYEFYPMCCLFHAGQVERRA
ncbi:ArdC-like ssDNA-binding domain-containing protein [Thalassotalea marina]|uniref:N-terminal domain-containing protein n=1 Tax=Thalassotalea marina TaxID=1673741 RepID=A0A919BRJ8_9GAMM|nr:ArdC-like ssDNA-binding domain-containing protein [Thalassotalea marina]GHG07243.1 hypothetical protein GCM10017161_41220 [Thalassotalea marina]